MIYFIGAYLMIGSYLLGKRIENGNHLMVSRFYYIIGSLTGLIFLPITELIEWLKN